MLTENRHLDVKYINQEEMMPMTQDEKDILRGCWF